MTTQTKPATKKAAKPAKAPAKAPAKKVESKKQVATGGKVKVTQIQGCIARKWDQQATLIGLGLNKRHRSRILVDTPEVRGMLRKVGHLIKVEKAS